MQVHPWYISMHVHQGLHMRMALQVPLHICIYIYICDCAWPCATQQAAERDPTKLSCADALNKTGPSCTAKLAIAHSTCLQSVPSKAHQRNPTPSSQSRTHTRKHAHTHATCRSWHHQWSKAHAAAPHGLHKPYMCAGAAAGSIEAGQAKHSHSDGG